MMPRRLRQSKELQQAIFSHRQQEREGRIYLVWNERRKRRIFAEHYGAGKSKLRQVRDPQELVGKKVNVVIPSDRIVSFPRGEGMPPLGD